MKRAGMVLLLALALSGCAKENHQMNRALALRSRVLAASRICFQSAVTADYGDRIQSFSMDCAGSGQAELAFSMTAPEYIAGIAGTISHDRGSFRFADKTVYYGLLTDDQLSPVSAPWIFLKALAGGYIRCVGPEGELLRLTLEDTYRDSQLQVDIWLEEETPVRGDILCDGKRILSLEVEDFEIS